ncbi:MAG: RagB/SusD family nutrient uptake outer membrane protein [Gloeobacteraceae cyanobacterium ES-bin-316]|nr:RagB/SusD family nutrient uptake outer membrane protein [Ferruginibacter sp.]
MKHSIVIVAFLIAIIFASCEKEVTDIKPNDRLSSDLAFSTAQKAEAAVIGGYDALQSANYLSGRALVYVDLMGEDVYDKGNFFGDLPSFNMLSNNGFPAGVWTAGYAAIATANRAIAGIAANPTILTPAKAKELTAECLFVRAVSHFYLVNFFAQPYVFTANATHPGIPVVKRNFSSNDPAANLPRVSVADVYKSILEDLDKALLDLPAAYTTTYATKTRATQAAAAAMLSRVNLYKADYAKARSFSLNIIDGLYGNFLLNASPSGVFGPGNYTTTESIWSIPNNASDNPNTNNALPQHYFPAGRADIALSASFLSGAANPYFALDDKRRTLMIINGNGGNAAFFFTNKYPDVANRADWAPIIRYSEVLLTYAEANARLATDVDPDAIQKLNLVRDRSRVGAAQYTVAGFANKDSLLKAILGERRIELSFEGHRFWDVMRLKGSIVGKYDNDGVSILPVQVFGADKNIFPIPQAEIDKSRGVLVQNPGY